MDDAIDAFKTTQCPVTLRLNLDWEKGGKLACLPVTVAGRGEVEVRRTTDEPADATNRSALFRDMPPRDDATVDLVLSEAEAQAIADYLARLGIVGHRREVPSHDPE